MYYSPSMDIQDYNKPTSEYVYYHGPAKSKSSSKSKSESESESEGMTNDAASCWMISVIQALRASDVFRKEFAPKPNEKDEIKKELFRLFDVAEGKNGNKRRPVTSKEIRAFKKLIIKKGLPANMDDGFHQATFLKFLLKQFNNQSMEYESSSKKKKEMLFNIKVIDSTKRKSVQDIVNSEKTVFGANPPRFLPIYVDRPRIKDEHGDKWYSRAVIIPSEKLDVPVKGGKTAHYKLVSIVICRDSTWHAYTYVPEKSGWVEYEDGRVIIHKSPETKLRGKNKSHTPHEDACKHSTILIYEATS